MRQAQSYYSTIFKGRFTTYEMRIMFKIVQRARELMKSQGRYSDFMTRAYHTDGFNLVMAFPVSELIGGRTHNWASIKNAVRALKSWQVEFYDKDRKEWHIGSMVDNATLKERDGVLVVTCSQWLIDFITDFRNGGYREYTFEIAMSFHNPFAARFYILTASLNKPFVYPLDALREIMGVKDKYSRVHDFLRRVVDPAMSELEAKQANGFKYELVRRFKDKPKSEVTGLLIIPVKRELREQAVERQYADFDKAVPSSIRNFLSSQLHFSWKELRGNKDTLAAFCSLDGWQDKLLDITERCRRLGKNHGYIISAMKSEAGIKK